MNVEPSTPIGFRAVRLASLAIAICVYAYAAAVLGAWALIWLAGDRWWFATILLMGPRWIYALPMVLLVPPALIRWRWLLPLGVSAAVITGPIMGLNVPWGAWREPATSELRVLTFNIQRWNVKEQDFAALLDAMRPDLVAVQECATSRWQIPPEWHVERAGELIVASRYPIQRSEISRCLWPPGRKNPVINGLYCVVAAPAGPIGFASIHLDTPRRALGLILDPEKVFDLEQVDHAEAKLEYRSLESRDLARWLDGLPEPKIIAGDFNMPVESTIYRDNWSSFTNAFTETGWGYGHTKRTKINRFRFGSRIDHILSTAEFRPAKSWTGPAIGSDHLPLIADFAFDPDPLTSAP